MKSVLKYVDFQNYEKICDTFTDGSAPVSASKGTRRGQAAAYHASKGTRRATACLILPLHDLVGIKRLSVIISLETLDMILLEDIAHTLGLNTFDAYLGAEQ